ncbi:hypothetical protein CCUS01_08420 [Colletotrichum cuscutae]|uniref:Uncharacterized protein n=1 Tax=Colletotrichum cuscutae TaxID=1209917 RepID=A0AAI9XWU8_9PEZI|nr:hypothetical protein CCUS01_08420 [Colletotrichum cuscutae]
MIGGILRPKMPDGDTAASTLARPRYCIPVTTSTPQTWTTTVVQYYWAGLRSPIQSRSLQNQQQGTVTRLLDLETRIADALPHPVTQSPQY